MTEDNAISSDDVDFYVSMHIRNLPERLARLLERVLRRLPEEWDEHAEWKAEFSEESDAIKKGKYGEALHDEGIDTETTECWDIKFYPTLEELSDEAVLFVIAHELAHVASKAPCAGLTYYTETGERMAEGMLRELGPDEKTRWENKADEIALSWGFASEKAAFDRDKTSVCRESKVFGISEPKNSRCQE